jgi:hypothetical protein
MSKDLFIISRRQYAVVSNDKSFIFSDVDQACDFLESIGVPPDEVDHGLIQLATNSHTRAHFGSMNGNFILSDNLPYTHKVDFENQQ